MKTNLPLWFSHRCPPTKSLGVILARRWRYIPHVGCRGQVCFERGSNTSEARTGTPIARVSQEKASHSQTRRIKRYRTTTEGVRRGHPYTATRHRQANHGAKSHVQLLLYPQLVSLGIYPQHPKMTKSICGLVPQDGTPCPFPPVPILRSCLPAG
jgi:hypothetical protein